MAQYTRIPANARKLREITGINTDGQQLTVTLYASSRKRATPLQWIRWDLNTKVLHTKTVTGRNVAKVGTEMDQMEKDFLEIATDVRIFNCIA